MSHRYAPVMTIRTYLAPAICCRSEYVDKFLGTRTHPCSRLETSWLYSHLPFELKSNSYKPETTAAEFVQNGVSPVFFPSLELHNRKTKVPVLTAHVPT